MTEQEIALLASFAPLAGIKGTDSLIETLKGEGDDDLTAENAAIELANRIKANFAKVKETQTKRGSSDLKKSVLRTLTEQFPELTEGLDSEGKITDFVESFGERAKAKLAKKATDSSPEPLEITPEFLSSNPIARDFFSKEYNRKLEADRKKLKEATEALERERKEARTSTVRSKLTTAVAKRAKEMNVALEIDGVPSGLRLQKMLQLPDFNPANWKVEGDEVVPVDANGNRAEDEMGNYLSVDDFISRNNIYGVVKLDQNKSTPSMRTNPAPSANSGGKHVFKDQDDFARQYNAIPRTKETKALRAAMLEAMEEQHPPTKK